MTSLRRNAEQYLEMRRALGYKLDITGWLVARFADHCDSAGITHVTIEVALDWAVRPSNVTAWYRWLRLNAVRGFVVYLHALDPAHQVPPSDLLPCRQQRPTPYLLPSPEVAALMDAAATMRPPLCAATYRTLLGLMAVTGMRPGEAALISRVSSGSIYGRVRAPLGDLGVLDHG
jgi:integrase